MSSSSVPIGAAAAATASAFGSATVMTTTWNPNTGTFEYHFPTPTGQPTAPWHLHLICLFCQSMSLNLPPWRDYASECVPSNASEYLIGTWGNLIELRYSDRKCQCADVKFLPLEGFWASQVLGPQTKAPPPAPGPGRAAGPDAGHNPAVRPDYKAPPPAPSLDDADNI